MPYGADAYMYSRIVDPSLRHGLLMCYPTAARRESEITTHVAFWTRRADVAITGLMTDGMGRWDVALPSPLVIDAKAWTPKERHSPHDGRDGSVVVIHTPNHRGFKGTEFLVEAVDALRAEGLRIELQLIEGVQNDEVRRLLREADILAEQFICTGYAMSAIEGMASGLPVLSNLDHADFGNFYRRYSFLAECPILSTTPETLKANLRALTTRPDLRAELGRAGRQYVEKYHSFGTAQYLFGAIYRRTIHGSDVDLMNLFHPLKSEYNRRTPIIKHPLVSNKLAPTSSE